MNPLRNQLATLWLSALCLTLAGCVTTPKDVLTVACDRSQEYSTERCAKSIAELYEVYQKRGEELKADPLAPADVKEAVQTADAAATPVILELVASTRVYVEIKSELDAGATQDERLAIANANLEGWVQKAMPRIKALIRATGGRP